MANEVICKYKDALNDYTKFLEINPQDPDVLNVIEILRSKC